MAVLDVTEEPYGADGDGSTDDTVAIQNAIDDASPGDTIHLPAGEYLVSQKESKDPRSQPIVEISGDDHADGITLEGDGESTTIVRERSDDSYALVRVSEPNDFTLTIRDLVLDGKAPAIQSDRSAAAGLSFRETDGDGTGDMLVENVRVQHCGKSGVSIQYGGVVVRDCTARDNYGHGFAVVTSSSGMPSPTPQVKRCYSVRNGGEKPSGGPVGNGINCHGIDVYVEDFVSEDNFAKATKTSYDANNVTYNRFRAIDNDDASYVYNTTNTPSSATITFKDFVAEGNNCFMRMSSGEHLVPDGHELVLSQNGPESVSEHGQLFMTDGVEFKADGDIYSNRAVDGAGLNAWNTASTSYLTNYYHYRNDAGAVKNDNIQIDSQEARDKSDITGVPTADEVGAWSGDGDDRVPSVGGYDLPSRGEDNWGQSVNAVFRSIEDDVTMLADLLADRDGD